MFATDLTQDYDAAAALGLTAAAAYASGVEGALCDDATLIRIAAIGDAHAWA